MKNEATIDGITVGGQPTREELLSGRFGAVINVRRHDEPGNDSAEMLADSAIAYTAVPYTADTVTKDDIARVRAAVDAAGGPVLIHWMGGTRAAVAAAIVSAEKDGSGAAGVLAKLRAANFDIDGTPFSSFVQTYFA